MEQLIETSSARPRRCSKVMNLRQRQAMIEELQKQQEMMQGLMEEASGIASP
jgi:hypothetical protein